MRNQIGISQILLLVILGLAIVVIAVFSLGVNPFKLGFNNSDSSPARSNSASQGETLEATEKQRLYEENKDDIKGKLNLSEKEFQTLKRYSRD